MSHHELSRNLRQFVVVHEEQNRRLSGFNPFNPLLSALHENKLSGGGQKTRV